MPQSYLLLLPLTLVVGLSGTRTAFFIRHANGKWSEELFMMALCWSPLVIALLALLLTLSGTNP